MKIIKCEVDWVLGYSNTPRLKVFVDEATPLGDLAFKQISLEATPSGHSRTLYYAEQNGFVTHYHHNEADESGYGGRTFYLTLEDGTIATVKGPWNSGWSPADPVPQYSEVSILEPTSVGGIGGDVTNEKYRELIETFCPEAELIEIPGFFGSGTRLRIKRKGQELEFPTSTLHGTVLNQKYKFMGCEIEVFWVPESGLSVWHCTGEHNIPRSKVFESPAAATFNANHTIGKLRRISQIVEGLRL